MSAFDDSASDRKARPTGFRAAMFAREDGYKAYWPLVHAGMGSFEEVAAMTERELLAIDEIDPERLGMIREVLAEHGYKLRRTES
ncbi:MAG: hypothetical protein M3Q31_05265 [Actinomycetota bacterium]|nr:hypothetical protein [Actinomycetota bacterium]